MENQTGNTRPPNYVGMLSPDGWWQWNGMQWLPVGQRPQGSKGTFWPVLAALVAFSLILLVAYGFYDANKREHRWGDEVDQSICRYDPSSC